MPVHSDEDRIEYQAVGTGATEFGFNYAIEFDDAGYEVQVFVDGRATKWPAEFAENPDWPFNHDWEQIENRGLLAGACGYCANALDDRL